MAGASTRDGEEPELMALMAHAICVNKQEVLRALDGQPIAGAANEMSSYDTFNGDIADWSAV